MDPLLTPKDVQKMLNVSLALVYRMADRGQLPCVRWNSPGGGEKNKKSVVRFEREAGGIALVARSVNDVIEALSLPVLF